MAHLYDLIFNNKFVKFLKSYSSAVTIQYESAAVHHCVYHLKKYVKKEKTLNVGVLNQCILWKSTLL